MCPRDSTGESYAANPPAPAAYSGFSCQGECPATFHWELGAATRARLAIGRTTVRIDPAEAPERCSLALETGDEACRPWHPSDRATGDDGDPPAPRACVSRPRAWP